MSAITLLTFPEDDRLLGETDTTLQWPGNGGGDNTYQREQTAYWLAEQMGLPYCYRRLVNLFVNGVRRAELFEDAQQPSGDMTDEFFPDGENGDLHKIQIWFEFDDLAAIGFIAQWAPLCRTSPRPAGRRSSPAIAGILPSAPSRTRRTTTRISSPLWTRQTTAGSGANYRSQLEATIDIDNWLKTYAVEHVVGNDDSFAYGGGQNMYTYKPRRRYLEAC